MLRHVSCHPNIASLLQQLPGCRLFSCLASAAVQLSCGEEKPRAAGRTASLPLQPGHDLVLDPAGRGPCHIKVNQPSPPAASRQNWRWPGSAAEAGPRLLSRAGPVSRVYRESSATGAPEEGNNQHWMKTGKETGSFLVTNMYVL